MQDAEIIQLYIDRKEQAIPATAAKYGHYCTSIANNILGNHEDVEECVNDTYLQTWNAIPPHKPKMLSTFLGKIIRNLAFNRYKQNTAEKRGGGELPVVLEELAECVSGSNDVEQTFAYKELVAAINDFLGRIPAKKRSIFICRYWYTDSIADIASQHNMTCAGVSMMLSRLRTQLRSELTGRGFDL